MNNYQVLSVNETDSFLVTLLENRESCKYKKEIKLKDIRRKPLITKSLILCHYVTRQTRDSLHKN